MTSPTSDRRQGLVGNTSIKAPVLTVATTNISLSGEQVINGATTSSSRVLATAQTDPTQNGIWDSSSAAWTRSKDSDGNYDLVSGTQVIATAGTYALLTWILTTSGSITIGTTALVWIQAVGQVTTYVPPGVTRAINVPATYTTINLALAAIAGWVILGTVQILVADGTYVPAATINLNHPFGQSIQLIGNISTPSNCILKPATPAFDLISVSGGRFGLIAGFLFDLPSKAGAANNYTAVLAVNGGEIGELKNCRINNWYYQIAAREGGSQIYAHDCTLSNAGDVAVWGFCGGSIAGSNLTVSGANDSANNLGYGFQAEYGGVVDVTTSSATTCYRAGFAALSNGTGRYYTCTANANTGSGFVAQAAGVIEANGSSSTNNTRYGMEFFGAGTCTGLSTNTGNALGTDNGALYLDQGSLGARIASNGDMRIDVNAGNNWFFNSSGGVQFSVSHSAASTSWIAVTGGASSPIMKSAGAATNIDINIQGKGTGFVFLGNNAANYLRVNPQASGTAPQLRAEGVDADIDILLGGKGAGLVRFGTLNAVGDAAMSGYITIKDAAGTTRKLMVTT